MDRWVGHFCPTAPPVSPVGRCLPKHGEQPSLLYGPLTFEGSPDTL